MQHLVQENQSHNTQHNSFVPAESAELGIIDKILVKSNTQDSVSQVSW